MCICPSYPFRYSERQGWLDIFSEEECDQMMTVLFDKAIEEAIQLMNFQHYTTMQKEKVKEEDVESSYVCNNVQIKETYKKY